MDRRTQRQEQWPQGVWRTLPLTTTMPVAQVRRSAPRHRVADALARMPAPVRRTTAAVLLLATAEMHMIGRYGDLGRTPDEVVVLLAPLLAAAAAAAAVTLGRLTHRTARLLGGAGHSDTTPEILVLVAATTALPGGVAAMLSDGNAAPLVSLVLAVTGLVLAVHVVAGLEAIGRVRATVALVVPWMLAVALLILLALIESATADLLPSRWNPL
jgi:hypothetical protein